MDSKLTGNLAMSFSKICSGLNQNALRYLQPTWMDAISGVLFRVVFASIVFWIVGLFARKAAHITWRDRLAMLCIGVVLMYGYMMGLLLGLTYSTPVSVSLILCTEPVWVLLMAACFFHRQVTRNKVLGIALGMAGCLVCILSQKSGGHATNPLLGNLCCLASSMLYAAYIIASGGLLKKMETSLSTNGFSWGAPFLP